MSLVAEVEARRGGFELQLEMRARRGEPVALLGPNGSGKSTLLRVIAGLHPLERGRVMLNEEVWEDAAVGMRLHPRARRVGMMFQGLALLPHMDAVQNVAYPLRAHLRRTKAERRAVAVMEEHGIAHLARRLVQELSGGERQAVALARALVAEPRLLLLDEPLSALDVRARGAARRHLRETLDRFDGVGIVVTHDPVEAGALAERVVVMESGGIVQEGTVAEIGARPRSRFAASAAGVNLLSGKLVRRGDLMLLETGAGDIVVVAEGMPEGSEALASVHPHALALSLERTHGSMRNVLAGKVEEVSVFGSRARVRLASRPPLTAEITSTARDELGLRPGSEVWVSFKATEVEVYPA